MLTPPSNEPLVIVQGDITRLQVDAIVNAANTTLLGGGGVDGAIHRGAGPELLEACRALHGCATGEAKITPGYALPARFVIHTVGPVWRGGQSGEDAALARCYQNSLNLAVLHGARTVAFPAISTGVYGFPMERAASIAVAETRRFISAHSSQLDQVVFVCFNRSAYDVYARIMGT
jgi:O-acetyl-ADP-ribose deacetylase